MTTPNTATASVDNRKRSSSYPASSDECNRFTFIGRGGFPGLFDNLTLVTTALLPLDDEEENDNDEDISTGNNDYTNTTMTTTTTTTTTTSIDKNNNNNIDFHPRIVFSTTNLDAYMQCNSQVWLAVRNRLLSLLLLDDVIIATATAVDTTTNSNDDDDDDSSNDAATTASIANNAKSSSRRRRRRMTTTKILIRPDNRLQSNPPLQQLPSIHYQRLDIIYHAR